MVVAVKELLRVDSFGELASFRDQGEGSFTRWLGVVAGHRAVSCTRAHPDNDRGRWVRTVPVPEALEAEWKDPIQTIDARALLALARKVLREDQLEALHAWLEEDDYAEIARRLGLGGPQAAKAAKRRVRTAIERLRRHAAAPPPRERRAVAKKSTEPCDRSTRICALYGTGRRKPPREDHGARGGPEMVSCSRVAPAPSVKRIGGMP
jgi:hypothetical protein